MSRKPQPPAFDAGRLAANLQALRVRKGLTYEDIADGISPSADLMAPESAREAGQELKPVDAAVVRRWFKKEHPSVPSVGHLLALAQFFQVSVEELLLGPDEVSTVPPPISYNGRPLIRLARRPRPAEERGVTIARKLCEGRKPAAVRAELGIDDDALFDERLRRAAYGDLFEVIEPAPEDQDLANQLKAKHGLMICRVAAVGQLEYGLLQTVVLGALGAALVREQMQSLPPKVGVAGGFSCARVVISLVQTLSVSEKPHLWPIAVQGAAGHFNALNGNALVGMFGYLTGRTGSEDVTLLEYASNLELREKPGHPTNRHLQHIVDNTSIAFLGVSGDVSRSHSRAYGEPAGLPGGASVSSIPLIDLRNRGVIGDVLYNWVTKEEVVAHLTPECDRMVCSIGLSGLARLAQNRRVPVVALVADAYPNKIDVLKLALGKGYINSLVITDTVAQRLLD